MADIGQGQTGSLRSTPKLLNTKASDRYALMFKNYGNNHNAPLFWSSTATIASGDTEVTVVSGVKFYDMDLATYASVTATPTSDPGASFWVEKDVVNNEVKIVVGSAVSGDVVFNVQTMLGACVDISAYSTRGSGSPQQSYP